MKQSPPLPFTAPRLTWLATLLVLGSTPPLCAQVLADRSPSENPCAYAFEQAQEEIQKENQEGTDKDPQGKDSKKGDKKIERLTEWPKLEAKSGAGKQVQRLVKAGTEEMGLDAAREIAKIGASAAPLLIKELAKTRDEETAERIAASLDAITGAPHTRLLAEHFDHKKPNVRRYALERVSHFPDTGTKKLAEAAYKKSLTKKSRWEPRDRYLSALCCASAGSDLAVDDLIEAARKSWGKRHADLSRTLPSLRSNALTKNLIDTIATEKRQDIVDTLRLLSLCGTKTGLDFVKPLLDSDDASIRVAAINACRGIVTGEPPLGKLSAFEAIELAKEWKAKI